MVDISFKQYKILKRINKSQSIKYEELSEEEIKTCDFLAEKNFISLNTDYLPVPNNPYNVHRSVPNNYEITEEGKAQIYVFKSKFYQIRFSMIMSVISVIISIIALLKP